MQANSVIADEMRESCGWPGLPLMMLFTLYTCLPHIKIRQVIVSGY